MKSNMRKTVAKKNGFTLTWFKEVKNPDDHKWWHFFFTHTQPIIEKAMIKSKVYVKKRIWLVTCKKCSFTKVDGRELWLPGEAIDMKTSYFARGPF